MRHRFRFALALLVLTLPPFSRADNQDFSGNAIVQEMNLARQNPALYASFLEELRANYNGRVLVLPGRGKIYTKEGVRAVDEAIRFLRSARPLPPLSFSPGISKGAADHCADQSNGRLGHNGSDGSNAGQRMSRYGVWSATWGENLSYGRMSARQIVLALIIDDGLRGRKHRKNIFNSRFNYAGAALGRHARFGTVCSIDFAGTYVEHDAALVARN
jgi:uncharacterized protein YkwD